MQTYATHEDAQSPNHTCPLKFLCSLHDKCRLSRNSLISVLELKSLVLVHVLDLLVLDNIPVFWYLLIKSLFISDLICFQLTVYVCREPGGTVLTLPYAKNSLLGAILFFGFNVNRFCFLKVVLLYSNLRYQANSSYTANKPLICDASVVSH